MTYDLRLATLLRPLLCLALSLGGGAQAFAQGLTLTEQRIASYVDHYVEDAIALLERTTNINSGTMNFDGVREVGRVFQAELDSLGFRSDLVDQTGVDRAGHLVAVGLDPGRREVARAPGRPTLHASRPPRGNTQNPAALDTPALTGRLDSVARTSIVPEIRGPRTRSTAEAAKCSFAAETPGGVR